MSLKNSTKEERIKAIEKFDNIEAPMNLIKSKINISNKQAITEYQKKLLEEDNNEYSKIILNVLEEKDNI